MRYGLLADIHSNLPALESVLEELAHRGVDGYLCLGDVVGYGAFPNECCELLRSLNALVVRGNHDEAAVRPGKELWFTTPARRCIEWTREVLKDEHRAFLASLEPLQVLDGLVLCHGSVHDPDFYTTTPREALLSFRVMPQPICLFGHTHCAEWYEYQPMGLGLPLQHPLPDGGVVELREGTMYMINPGAVGQPRDGNSQAACAVLDLERRQVELVRVPYDIARAQEALLAAGLPEAMGARLSFGI